MKRIYIASFLMVVSVGLCFFCGKKNEERTSYLYAELEAVAMAIREKDTEGAIGLLDNADTYLRETERLLSVIVDADKVEELTISFSMIKAHLFDGNTEHALERLRECELMLTEIAEDEKLKLKNIL